MLRWKQLCAVLALGIAVTAPGVASAQQAPARPAPAQVQAAAPAAQAQRPILRARDLMTPQERQAYRQAMRGARNDPARREQIRTQMRQTLRDRAAARGGVLAEPAMAKPGMKAEAARPEKRPAAPPRAP